MNGSNSLYARFPDIAAELHPTLNDVDPKKVFAFTSEMVFWLCPYNHTYECRISDRTGKFNVGCTKCSLYRRSQAELKLLFELRLFFDISVDSEWFRKDRRRVEADILIKELNLIIEYDGARWHKDRDKDLSKNTFLKELGYEVIRVRERPLTKLSINDFIVKSGKDVDLLKAAKHILSLLLSKYPSKVNKGAVADYLVCTELQNKDQALAYINTCIRRPKGMKTVTTSTVEV